MSYRPTKFIYAAALGCGIMLSACANSGADLNAAKLAQRSGDTEAAITQLEPMAAFGLPEAQVMLASLLMRKKDATQEELDHARDLLEKAAGKEDPAAFMYLGRMYARGIGVPKNFDAAKTNYEQAISMGYDRAVVDLAGAYEKEKDFDRAEALYIQAYNGKYYKAGKNLARLFEKGWGRKKDLATALSWYIAAQRNGVTGLDEKIEKLQNTLGPERSAQAEELSKGYDVDEKI